MKNSPSVSIVGFGRFGQTLYRLLGEEFAVTLYTRNPKRYKEVHLHERARTTQDIAQIYESQVIFYTVPIGSFESVVAHHREYMREDNLLVDCLSVKQEAERVFGGVLGPSTSSGRKTKKQHEQIIEKFVKAAKETPLDLPSKEGRDQAGGPPRYMLTHPMFGPDSSREGFAGLRMMMNQGTARDEEYAFWKEWFSHKDLEVFEMSAAEHDELAARSQGVAHYIGRGLADIDYQRTKIDTKGAEKLSEIMEQTTNDTDDLFFQLQNYNKYTVKARTDLFEALESIHVDLLNRRSVEKPRYGIQGGPASFNQQAVEFYLKSHGISLDSVAVKHLYTSENVLRALELGETEYGLFAIQNSIGGMVTESIEAMARYRFEIVEEFAIPIQHHLMVLPGESMDKVETIMAHPQVLKQCKSHLSQQYGKYALQSGEGELIDTARAAEALSNGDLPKSVAILGPEKMSELYGLEIVDRNLQDDETNNTTFLLVSRRGYNKNFK